MGRATLIDKAYAEHGHELARLGLVALPCREKRPLVKNLGRWTPGAAFKAHQELSHRFQDAQIGVICGEPSDLTVIDIDSSNEELINVAFSVFGETPVVVATPSGGFHLCYAYNGEKSGKLDRIDSRLVGDLKARGGLVIAPPSLSAGSDARRSGYSFLSGDWYTVWQRPALREGCLQASLPSGNSSPSASKGRRNSDMFRHLLKQAPHCDDVDTLIDVALTWNDDLLEPLSIAETEKTARSAWRYQQADSNWLGGESRVPVTKTLLTEFMDAPDALILLIHLRHCHAARAQPFALSPRAMARTGELAAWSEHRLRKARRVLIEKEFLKCVREGGSSPGDPSLYVFADRCKTVFDIRTQYN